jgi:hypothetical protein
MVCPSPKSPSRPQVPTPQIEWLGSDVIGSGDPTVGNLDEIGPD